jgi:hypothetical protein
MPRAGYITDATALAMNGLSLIASLSFENFAVILISKVQAPPIFSSIFSNMCTKVPFLVHLLFIIKT